MTNESMNQAGAPPSCRGLPIGMHKHVINIGYSALNPSTKNPIETNRAIMVVRQRVKPDGTLMTLLHCLQIDSKWKSML